MFERFTEKAIKVIMLAQEEARRLGHNKVATELMLLGLIGERTGIAAEVLKSSGLDLKGARTEVEQIIGRGSGSVAPVIPFTPRVTRIVELSWVEAKQLGHDRLCPEHLLLGIMRDGEGMAPRVLENLDVDCLRLKKDLLSAMRSPGEQAVSEEHSTTSKERCPYCGGSIQSQAMICRDCQRPLGDNAKKCPYCAEVVWKDAVLCRFCKSSLAKDQ